MPLRTKVEANMQAVALANDFNSTLPGALPTNPLIEMMIPRSLNQTEEALDAGLLSTVEGEELEHAKKEMTKAWRELQSAYPPDQDGAKNKKSSTEIIKTIFGRRKADEPDLTDVNTFKTRVIDLCVSLDNYSGVFDFFPSSNEYASVICGVLTTIVQATVRHRKTDEGFTDALQMLRDYFLYCHGVLKEVKMQELELHKRQIYERITARFFTDVFKFLLPYVRWCNSGFERTKAALNKNYEEENIKEPLRRARERMESLNQQVNIDTLHNTKKITQQLDAMERRRSIVSKSPEVYLQQMQSMRMDIKKLGTQMNFLTAYAKLSSLETPSRVRRLEPNGLQATPESQEQGQLIMQTLISKGISFETVRDASSHLEMFNEEKGYPLELNDAQPGLQSDPRLFEHITDWTLSAESSTLWVCGSISTKLSDISLATGYMVLLAERAYIPMIAYQCRLDDPGLAQPGNDGIPVRYRSMAMDRLVALLYSLIRQLVWLLPDTIATSSDLGVDRFTTLDGSTPSLLDTLNLFEELLALAPATLMVIIDGFQLVDNDDDHLYGTGGYLEIFLEILRKAGEVPGRTVKALLASDGNCLILSDDENIGLDEQLHIFDDAGKRWIGLDDVEFDSTE